MCARFLVELVELMLNTYIYSLWNYLAFSKLGSAFPGWIGWISTRSFWYFKEIKISPSMCLCFLVELVELMLNTYIHSLWDYLAFSELGSAYPGWIIELALNHFKILKKLKFLLVCVRDSWLNWLHWCATHTVPLYDTI